MLARKAAATVPMTRIRVIGAFVKPEESIVEVVSRAYCIVCLMARWLLKLKKDPTSELFRSDFIIYGSLDLPSYGYRQ